MSVVALVPARSGSRRIPNKNVRPLRGHPLLAYTLAAAADAEVFADVVVSTDSPEVAEIARHYGARAPFLRPIELAGDFSPDIDWVRHALKELRDEGSEPRAFSILRPTSPLRQPETIQRAWKAFSDNRSVDSLRAVELCAQHPGKMWLVDEDSALMHPLLDDGNSPIPWHSTPYQALPRVYVQNASLEIAWVKTVDDTGTIAGHKVRPFFTEGYEGFDLNEPRDWTVLEQLLDDHSAVLPQIRTQPWSDSSS